MKKNNNWLKLTECKDLYERVAFNPSKLLEVKNFFDAPIENRVVLLQSVRGANGMPDYVKDFISKSNASGNPVYVPFLHNDENDPHGGLLICNTMRYVVENCSTVAIAYNPLSEGTKFDFGLTLMNNKKVNLLNPESVEDDGNDSVGLLIKANNNLMDLVKSGNMSDEYEDLIVHTHNLRKMIQDYDSMPFELNYVNIGENMPPALVPEDAMLFGMVYASRKPFEILNLSAVEAQSKLEDELNFKNSYSKVALQLNSKYDL